MAVGNQITTVLTATAAGATVLQESVIIDQDVYDVYKFVVAKSGGTARIDMPLCATNLLAIMADSYADSGVTKLAYAVHGGSAITLDCMQVFTGFDMVEKLGALDYIIFTNTSTIAARTITVIAARDRLLL